jgi:hypothetical protein
MASAGERDPLKPQPTVLQRRPSSHARAIRNGASRGTLPTPTRPSPPEGSYGSASQQTGEGCPAEARRAKADLMQFPSLAFSHLPRLRRLACLAPPRWIRWPRCERSSHAISGRCTRGADRRPFTRSALARSWRAPGSLRRTEPIHCRRAEMVLVPVIVPSGD